MVIMQKCEKHRVQLWDANPGTDKPNYVCVKCLLEEKEEIRLAIHTWFEGYEIPIQTIKRLLRELNGYRNNPVPLCDGHAASWFTERNHLKGDHRCVVCAFTPNSKDLTIRELQSQLPWTVHYHRDFRASPMAHKDFAHSLTHVTKACGKLAAVVNDAEHGGSDFSQEKVDRYVADLVVCALRMATTCPGRQIDLQRAVEDRIENKNGVNLEK